MKRNAAIRLLVNGLYALGLLAVAVIVLQMGYLLFPAPENEAVRALDARLAQRPRDTDNGLRLHGLNAPAALDPVAYGRCVLAAERDFYRSMEPLSGHGMDRADRDQRVTECTQGHALLDLPGKDSLPAIQLTSELPQWQALARVSVDPRVMARMEAVLSGPPRFLGVGSNDSIASHLPALLRLHQIRTAQALLAWRDGRSSEALDQWEADLKHWSQLTGENLVSSMTATNAMGATLLSMQAAWRLGPPPSDPQMLEQIQRITHATDGLPEALSAAMLSEWGMLASTSRQFTQPEPQDGAVKPSHSMAASWTGAVVFGTNDFLNRIATDITGRTVYLAAQARGQTPAEPTPPGCRGNGPITWREVLCLPFSRNALGQILLEFVESPPAYGAYGLRVADLRNLAAATRLVAALRAQAHPGPALAQRVQQALADQRDIHTGQPFALDATAPAVILGLRAPMPWLGATGEHRLPL